MNESTPLVLTQPTAADSPAPTMQTLLLTSAGLPTTAEYPANNGPICLSIMAWPASATPAPAVFLDQARMMLEQALAHLAQLTQPGQGAESIRPTLLPALPRLPLELVSPLQLRLRVLGRAEVAWQGTSVRLPKHGLETLTMFVLAGTAGLTGDEIRERLFGDSDSGRAGWRKLLERLRGLMPGVIEYDGTCYRLNVAPDQIDADVLVVRDTPLAGGSLNRLLQAAEYARETLLPGQEATWVRGERERLWRRGVDLWLALADQARAQADAELAVRAYQAARELGPLQERVVVAAMRHDLELGRSVHAVTTFLEYRQLLDETLGMDPPPLVAGLYRQALSA